MPKVLGDCSDNLLQKRENNFYDREVLYRFLTVGRTPSGRRSEGDENIKNSNDSKSIIALPSKPAIPDSGRYTFSATAAIRNEAKMTAPVLATYGAGDGVTYDRVLEADGHWWISYISYSGARRYIAIA